MLRTPDRPRKQSVPYQPKYSGLSFPTASTYPVGPVKAPEKSPAYPLVREALSVPPDTGLSSALAQNRVQSTSGEISWGLGAPTHPVGYRHQGPLHTRPPGATCLNSTPSAC